MKTAKSFFLFASATRSSWRATRFPFHKREQKNPAIKITIKWSFFLWMKTFVCDDGRPQKQQQRVKSSVLHTCMSIKHFYEKKQISRERLNRSGFMVHSHNTCASTEHIIIISVGSKKKIQMNLILCMTLLWYDEICMISLRSTQVAEQKYLFHKKNSSPCALLKI